MIPAMADVWADVASLDDAMQDRLAAVLEERGADAQQRALRETFLAEIAYRDGARVLEVGCGTGVLTRQLARRPGIASVLGVDSAPSLLDRARTLAGDLENVEFEVGDARSLSFADDAFDVVVFDSTLSHVPGPDVALAEAYRVLRPAGALGVFDGDYATVTVALGEHDPLQRCVDAMVAGSVTDRWVVRRLPALVRASGFVDVSFRSHGYAEIAGGDYMLSIVDRGVDVLRARDEIGDELASALEAEGRRRVAAGTFFGHIAYGSLTARKPAEAA
jgi:ubiquinone/menaquinone biosynthesis C-methylase UbiE